MLSLRAGMALSAVAVLLMAVGAATWSAWTGFAALTLTAGVLVGFGGIVGLLGAGPTALAPKWRFFIGSFLYWLAVDQLTKLGTTRLRLHVDEIPVIPGWLSIVHAQNFGAAFSSLEGHYWLFIAFTLVATLIVADLMRRMRADLSFMATVLGMVLSGAWGNALDRLTKGHVTDFIRVYTDAPGLSRWLIQNFGTNTWPIFNVADSALLVGVTLFLVHYLFLEEEDPPPLDEEDEDPAGAGSIDGGEAGPGTGG